MEGCTAPHHAKGYCKSHYSQLRRHGDVEDSARSSLCEIAGCPRQVMEGRRCEIHLKTLSGPGAPFRLTRAQRLDEIRRRYELMRTEIERVKQSFDAEADEE